MTVQAKESYLELLEDQRSFLSKLGKTSDIPDELIRHQIYQIDLEEERIKLL